MQSLSWNLFRCIVKTSGPYFLEGNLSNSVRLQKRLVEDTPSRYRPEDIGEQKGWHFQKQRSHDITIKEENGYTKAFKVVQNATWRTHRSWTSSVGTRNFCFWQGHVKLLEEGIWGLRHQKIFQANQAGNHLPVCRELFSVPKAAHGPSQQLSPNGPNSRHEQQPLHLLHSRVLATPSIPTPSTHPCRHKSLTASVPHASTCHCFTDSRQWREEAHSWLQWHKQAFYSITYKILKAFFTSFVQTKPVQTQDHCL